MKKKYRLSLRPYFALVSIAALCFACLIAFLLVAAVTHLFIRGEYSREMTIAVCLFACCLAMGIGGLLLWIGAKHMVKPLVQLSNAVSKVAHGDFKVQIVRNKLSRSGHEYTNEIDELVENFNKMTKELDGMDYMRKDFMSNVSHEVKTPVAAIAGFSEIVMDGGLSEAEQKEYLTLVHQESLRLVRLCDNMLRMSRLDFQEIVTRHESVRVDEQLRKCVILLTETWQEKNFRLEMNLEKAVIISDADLLLQIWMNLIDNAMKYSKADSTIWISCESSKEWLKVIIKDEGIGIPKEKCNRIFDKFYQCEESHKKSGNGLGLSIVKRIVELLGGKITCDSEENMGTEMVVMIPKESRASDSN